MLDPVMAGYVEEDGSPDELIADGFERADVEPRRFSHRSGRVQASPDAPGSVFRKGVRQGPAHAHHQQTGAEERLRPHLGRVGRTGRCLN